MPRERNEEKIDSHLILFFRVITKNIKLLLTMGFTNALADNEEDLQDEDFYYDEEDIVEECELFKHGNVFNVYEGNQVLSMEEEISSLEKFNKEGITPDVIPSLRFIDKTLYIEMVVETENITVSPVMKEGSKSYECPISLKIYKTVLHYVKHISEFDKSIATGKSSKFIELIQLNLKT